MVLEMKGLYPFGQAQEVGPEVKILVRKIVPYGKYNYSRLKDKFEIAKKMQHINLVRLLRVLEEEGRFHLIYDYVPYPALHSPLTFEMLEVLKMKLIYLCVYLVECRILTDLHVDSVGLDERDELRYYLDSDFQFSPEGNAKAHDHYTEQIERVVQELQAYGTITEVSSEGFSKPKTSLIHKEADGSSIRDPPPRSIRVERQPRASRMSPLPAGPGRSRDSKTQSPSASLSRPISSTLQMLNTIEQKLDQLKMSIRKYSPKHAEQKRHPQSAAVPPPVLKNQVERRALDSRKYSGDVRSMQSLVQHNLANSTRSVRSGPKVRDKFLDRIRESNGEEEEVKAPPTQAPTIVFQKKRSAETRQGQKPALPKDRHGKKFLMEDDQESFNTRREKPKSKAQKDQKRTHKKESEVIMSTATELPPTAESKDLEEKQPAALRKPDEAEIKKEKELCLRERISKALRKSD